MNVRRMLLAALAFACASVSQAQVVITEVAAWSSGTSFASDWFELTNLGSSAVTITGWKMDDNSNTFASSVALNGITTIAAGESVIFVESSTSKASDFKTLWFGSNTTQPQVGYYTGSGVGLGTGGDAVNIFNASGALLANVAFGANTTPLATFENTTLGNNITLTTLSVAGRRGAFTAFNDANQIGSPGAAIPEPSTYALFLGAACLGVAGLRRRFCKTV